MIPDSFVGNTKQNKTKTTPLKTLYLTILPIVSHWPELGQVATPRYKGGWESRMGIIVIGLTSKDSFFGAG